MNNPSAPIQHLILDVDGVITGSLDNINTPFPHGDIASALRQIEAGGVSVTFCTGKPLFALREVIESVNIGGIHIADSGAQIFDLDKDAQIDTTPLDKTLARRLIETFTQANVYLEFYDSLDYYIRTSDRSALTEGHARILARSPKEITDPGALLEKGTLIKLVPVASGDDEKQKIEQLLADYAGQLHLYWGIHPNLPTVHFAVLTSPQASKRTAVEQLFTKAKINPQTTLAIGDSSGDWPFIDLCGFQAAMGNSDQNLLNKVSNSNKPHYIGGDVDENGLISILTHFGLM